MAGHRQGDEPVTARSALRLRLLLASLFTPVFLAGTAVFWYWTAHSGPHDAPSSGSLRTLTLISAALALFALVDLVVVLVRRRRERRNGEADEANGAGGDRVRS
ncbi:hypothetical protein KDA82_06780 [Streptomyces daliensis]|uniref:Uncharacterized protein n=1 Tax=Streptomyces daliensis TaxID=299421 RepID=A0A8T4IMV1_9ACTN|nr:hypothetical protein [Streptomyces daliensis]